MNNDTVTPNQTPTGEPLLQTPQLINVLEQPCAMIPLNVPTGEIGPAMTAALDELMQALAAQSILPTGPFFTHHLRVPDTSFDLEVCLPVSAPVAPSGRVVAGTWPSGTVARVRYVGDYAGLSAAWQEFMAWLAAKHHTPDLSRIYEQYLTGPRDFDDPKRWQTDLNVGLR